ncbi:MAG: glycerol-3-phosphate 1-O-acyltransferase PlsY [Ruminococcaceae bacterium]|nr:glycerol-3-phosphate 1-O-acyltransferase PlsY [Oscillospiraceae bacterium]
MVMTAIITVIAAYLIGSISFAIIFSNAFMKKDVRSMGSGNAGTTNVMRNGGFLPGALTFVCDALKGFVASFMGKLIFEYIMENTDAIWAQPIYGAYICGTACMLGHVFPIFFQFKGGKGVATSVGIFSVCCPIAIISGLAVFALVTIISKYVSLASIIATVTVVVLSIILYNKSASIIPQIVFIVIMGAIVILKHKENIKRLLAGTESKVGSRRRKS